MNSESLVGSGRRRGTSPLLLLCAFLAVAVFTSPVEGSLSRAGLQDANPAALAGAEAAGGGQLLAAGLETSFPLLQGDELEKALACNPLTSTPEPEDGELKLVEGPLLEPPELTSRACEASFSLHLEPVDFGLNPQRGPPLEIPDPHQGWFVAEPETRIGGFRLELQDLIKGECPLSLGLRRGYEVGGWGPAEEERADPWGLSTWSALQGYVAGITEAFDPTGMLPEVEPVDAGYRSGSRDAEDFAVSKETGKWALRALTFVKSGAQQIVRYGWREGVKQIAKQELRTQGKVLIAGQTAGAVEEIAEAAGVDEETARLMGGAAGAATMRPQGPSVMRATSSGAKKAYKAKIEGRAQKTGTPGHRFRTYREAIAEAKKPDVVSVHLDHGYNRALDLDPKTVSPNRRPDVVSLYDDDSVARIEVQSKTDVPAVLASRNAALDAQLKAKGLKPKPPRVVKPR